MNHGVPLPTNSAKLAERLPCWLDYILKPNGKRTTYAKYELHVRLYLLPPGIDEHRERTLGPGPVAGEDRCRLR